VLVLLIDEDTVVLQIMNALDTKKTKLSTMMAPTGMAKNTANALRLPNQQFCSPNLQEMSNTYTLTF
jgi:hypothetical protein